MLILIPASMYFRTYQKAVIQALHLNLQTDRITLTRLQQDFHQLENYAKRLRVDKKLLSVVMHESVEGSLWQTPMARARLMVQDAVNRLNASVGLSYPISIDWLDQPRSEEPGSTEVRPIWLSTKVASVPDGIVLLKALSDTVFPYPLGVRGCGYQRSQGTQLSEAKHLVEMRCLLNLTTWKLPRLSIDDLEGLDVDPIHVEPSIKNLQEKYLNISKEHQWRLLPVRRTNPSSIEPAPSPQSLVTLVEPKTVEQITVKPKIIEQKGVFTGPAGTWVIRVP